MLEKETVRIHAGIEKETKILLYTDCHLSLADGRDEDELLPKHSADRRGIFQREAGYPERDPIAYLEEVVALGDQYDVAVCTGDLYDFMSIRNFEETARVLKGHDLMYSFGNHDFCPRVGVPDSFDRRAERFDEVNRLFGGKAEFESRIINGLNLITIDNSYYVWPKNAMELLKKEVAKGYPCILCSHVPLHDKHLHHDPQHHDLVVDDAEVRRTEEITEYICNEPRIVSHLSGHWHGGGEYTVGENQKKCYVFSGSFKGRVGEIIVD